MSAPTAVEEPPLRRNRDFNLLWVGQVGSDLGANISAIAFPLLVLATTGSPAMAGIVAAARSLSELLFAVPGGALVDRWNLKRVMIVVDCARAAALGSLALAAALDEVAFGHIVAVAVVEGVGTVLFEVAEGSALPKVVADRHLHAALARNSARAHTAALAGLPLGGALFALGRAVPFLFDAVSYLMSVVTVSLVRTSLRRDAAPGRRRLRGEMRAGLSWYWRQSFLRVTSLVATTRTVSMTALYLVVIVIERERGASATLIGVTFAFIGVGGLLGSLAAPWLARRVSMRAVIIATPVVGAALVPLLSILPGQATPGVVFGAMWILNPLWSTVVGAHRLRITPPELRARVLSIATLIAGGPVPPASVAAGVLLETAGTTPTVIVFFAIMVLGAAIAVLGSRAVREAPDRAPSLGGQQELPPGGGRGPGPP
jgi:predicted MFS family arabinose efflux permease